MEFQDILKTLAVGIVIVFTIAIIFNIGGIKKCRNNGGGLYHYFSGKCDNPIKPIKV